MDTMTEHWGHLIGRTLEPPPSEEASSEPSAVADAGPVAAGDGHGESTNGEGGDSPTLGDGITLDDYENPSTDPVSPTSGDGVFTNGEFDGNPSAGSATSTRDDRVSTKGEGDGSLGAHSHSVPPTSCDAPSWPSTVKEMENERDSILKLRIC